MIRDLAAVGPVLELVSQAQALTFIDDAHAPEWLRLSERIVALRRSLKALLR